MMKVAKTCEVNKALCLLPRLTEIPNELTQRCAARTCKKGSHRVGNFIYIQK